MSVWDLEVGRDRDQLRVMCCVIGRCSHDPHLRIPSGNAITVRQVLPTAMSACLIGYMESIAIGKSLAAKHGYEIEAGQEMFALGISNLIGSVFSCYPVRGLQTCALHTCPHGADERRHDTDERQ